MRGAEPGRFLARCFEVQAKAADASKAGCGDPVKLAAGLAASLNTRRAAPLAVPSLPR